MGWHEDHSTLNMDRSRGMPPAVAALAEEAKYQDDPNHPFQSVFDPALSSQEDPLLVVLRDA
jgi:hypothetical protein